MDYVAKLQQQIGDFPGASLNPDAREHCVVLGTVQESRLKLQPARRVSSSPRWMPSDLGDGDQKVDGNNSAGRL